VALTLVLVACGDWAVYMFSTHGALADLIDSSLPRLLVQVWPTAVFLVFLTARAIERKPARAPAATKSPSTEPTRILAPATPVFSLVLTGIVLNVACGEGKAVSAFAAPVLPVVGWAVDTGHRRLASNVDVAIDASPTPVTESHARVPPHSRKTIPTGQVDA
jgi:hypothetical protein